ncbi:MAG: 3'(2'),5'-bisphosphate nucleotidase CysQ [Deltaproteobacteria bacterium]|jgi:3'(2'), 5'-bisphosphate nucleotidase|nr:3'(2'),5'-bisphosphate nucleotidase CysQ [Deltaproteobacteria bacterium]MBW2511245.1 3'(2'),5'-bisphosphate nucleotidase CysQ [Deltaproteobacteria bacterium]MDH4007386.1 3'(2'),5'-bisphosphate nucleotidase CysQ [Desulfuromonadales bacterium]
MILNNIDFDKVCAIARDAGSAIMEIYAGDFNVELKGDNSPLTCADRASHQVIVEGLQEATPDISILSEEGRDIPYAERAAWSRFWLVDPLDGTKEFIKRNDEFTVNIALVEDGLVTAGVVYVPAQDTMYFGGLGAGCWKTVNGDASVPIKVREADYNAGLTVVMSRSHPSHELETYLQEVNVAEALPVGSSLKLCVVAEGKADLYPRLGPTMEWDTAAGHAVVEAAGGTVTQVDGAPLRYNKENLLNPYFIVRGR